jgi:hypothetical protein
VRVSLSAGAIDYVQELGLDLPPEPEGTIPVLPPDITELTDVNLMQLLSELTRWAEYAGVEAAACAIEERACEAALERTRARAAISARGEKSVTAQKAAAAADPDALAADDELLVAYARRKLIDAILAGAERSAAVVSRELTRRVGRHDREVRSNKWAP